MTPIVRLELVEAYLLNEGLCFMRQYLISINSVEIDRKPDFLTINSTPTYYRERYELMVKTEKSARKPNL